MRFARARSNSTSASNASTSVVEFANSATLPTLHLPAPTSKLPRLCGLDDRAHAMPGGDTESPRLASGALRAPDEEPPRLCGLDDRAHAMPGVQLKPRKLALRGRRSSHDQKRSLFSFFTSYA